MPKALSVLLLSAVSALSFAQQNQKPAAPAESTPAKTAPATATPAAQSQTGAAPAPEATAPKPPDRAAAYYHYTLAHMYEEMAAMYNRSEDATKAIQEYRLALDADPANPQLNSGLAELYFKTGRLRDAITESKEVIQRDPNNVDARKLLGRIYLHSLGDTQSGSQSEEMLRLAIEQFREIVRLEPNDVDNHLLLGRLYLINKESPKAEEQFKAAQKIQPFSEEAVANLAYMYSENGEMDKAAAVLESVPETQRSAKLYQLLGQTYEQKHNYKKAVEAYREAADQEKDNLDIQRGLAQNLLNDGQADEALKVFKQIADADPQDAVAYIRMSEIYRHQNKLDLALDNLKKASSLVQDSLEIPYNQALIYESQGKYDDAIQLLSGLIEKTMKPAGSYTAGERNNRAVFLERLGTVYKESNRPQLAADTFRKMTELGDENTERAYQQLIDLYRDQRQWQQATAVAQEAVNKLPNNKPMKIVLAGQLADSGQTDKGVDMAKALLNGSPEDREVYVGMAQINIRLRRWSDAEQALDQAEKLSTKTEDKEYVDFLRGSMLERQKKYDLAEAQFRKVLANDPKNSMALNYLGYMMADRGVRLEEALGYIKKAVDQDPQNGAYLDSLGWAYFKIGNNEMAEESLRKAADRMANDGTVHDHLAEVYAKMGRLKLAVAQWERALEEWNRTVSADVEQTDVARVQKKLETTKVRLAREGSGNKQ